MRRGMMRYVLIRKRFRKDAVLIVDGTLIANPACHTTVITDCGYRGTGPLIPHRRGPGRKKLPSRKEEHNASHRKVRTLCRISLISHAPVPNLYNRRGLIQIGWTWTIQSVRSESNPVCFPARRPVRLICMQRSSFTWLHDY